MTPRTLLLSILLPCCVHAQQSLLIGEKSFEASEPIYFRPCTTSPELEISLVRDGSKGLIEFTSKWQCIEGEVWLYLDDNSVVKLLDRHIVDRVNEDGYGFTCRSVYSLSAGDIARLKRVNVSSMRFHLVDYIEGQRVDDGIPTAVKNTVQTCRYENFPDTESRRVDFPNEFRKFYGG